MVRFNVHQRLDVPAALFYISGALYGTAAGLVCSAIPEPSHYFPRVLKSVWDGRACDSCTDEVVPPLEPVDAAEYSMLPIVVCGAAGSGKTTILSWWHTGRRPAACKPTVGSDLFLTDVCVNSHVVSVQVWDTGGTLQCQRLGRGFWEKARAVLYVINLGDASTFQCLDQLDEMAQAQEWIDTSTRKPSAVLGVVRRSDSAARQVTVAEAEAWCDAHGAVYVEMSSSEDVAALDEVLELLVRNSICIKKVQPL